MRVFAIVLFVIIGVMTATATETSQNERRITATFSLMAASEKCGFAVDEEAVAAWMREGPPFTAEDMGLFDLLSLAFQSRVEQITSAECEDWQRIADEEGWLIE